MEVEIFNKAKVIQYILFKAVRAVEWKYADVSKEEEP